MPSIAPLASGASPCWKVECVDAQSLDDGLIQRWRECLPAGASPFLLPEWAQLSHRTGDVQVGVAECDGEIIAFIPFERRSRRALPIGDRFNDLQGIIQTPDAPEPIPIELVLQHCKLTSYRFRHWVAPSESMLQHCWEAHPFYFINLSEGFEAYSESRRGSKRHKLRREIGRLKRKAEGEFGSVTVHWTESNDTLRQLLTWKQEQSHRDGLGSAEY